MRFHFPQRGIAQTEDYFITISIKNNTIITKSQRLLSYDICTHQTLKTNKQKNRKPPNQRSIRDCISHQYEEALELKRQS